MAVSCMSVSVSSVGAWDAARSLEASGARPASRLTLSAPFLGSSSLSILDAATTWSIPLACRALRKVGIVTRAAAELLEQAPASAPPAAAKLYVGNLPWSTQSKELAGVFQQIGNVELVEVIYDRETQKSRGFAFVTMSTTEEALKAIDALDGTELDGRVIRVSIPQARERSNDRSERPQRKERTFSPRSADSENRLFVGNLSWGIDDGALDEICSAHGTVQEARVITDRETGRSRGFGFVTYLKRDEAEEALNALNGAEYDGRVLRVSFAGDKP